MSKAHLMDSGDDLKRRRDIRRNSERGLLFSPDAVLAIARDLHEMAEFRANRDVPARDWNTLSPEIRWEFFIRAQATTDRIDADRLGHTRQAAA